MRDNLIACFKSGIPLIAINTLEVERCTTTVKEIITEFNQKLTDMTASEYLKKNGLTMYVWNIQGWNKILPEDDKQTGLQEYSVPRTCLRWPLSDKAEPGIYVYQNLNLSWADPNLYPNIVADAIEIIAKKIQHRHVIVIGNINEIPADIAPLFSWIDFSLPTRDELAILTKRYDNIMKPKLTDEQRVEVADAVAGLTLYEADWAIRTSIVHKKGTGIDCNFIFAEKAKSVRKSGLLDYMPYGTDTIVDVGGGVTLKTWIKRIAKIFKEREEAAKYGLPIPRGTLLAGISGTGKSLTARIIAQEFGIPLYRWDLGKLFGSLVGSTEKNTREAFRLIEAVSPAVFYIDEIEKSLAGAESSSYTDSGVTARVVGAFLTFMQEKTCPAFFVATANSVNRLSPELLRRFNGIWFIDLPDDSERTEIFEIHIRKTGRDPKKFKIPELVKRTQDYTGAEIQNAVEEAMYSAFYRNEEYTTKDILEAISHLPILAETKREEIRALRAWAKGRARIANIQEGKTPPWWNDDSMLLEKIVEDGSIPVKGSGATQ